MSDMVTDRRNRRFIYPLRAWGKKANQICAVRMVTLAKKSYNTGLLSIKLSRGMADSDTIVLTTEEERYLSEFKERMIAEAVKEFKEENENTAYRDLFDNDRLNFRLKDVVDVPTDESEDSHIVITKEKVQSFWSSQAYAATSISHLVHDTVMLSKYTENTTLNGQVCTKIRSGKHLRLMHLEKIEPLHPWANFITWYFKQKFTSKPTIHPLFSPLQLLQTEKYSFQLIAEPDGADEDATFLPRIRLTQCYPEEVQIQYFIYFGTRYSKSGTGREVSESEAKEHLENLKTKIQKLEANEYDIFEQILVKS